MLLYYQDHFTIKIAASANINFMEFSFTVGAKKNTTYPIANDYKTLADVILYVIGSPSVVVRDEIPRNLLRVV